VKLWYELVRAWYTPVCPYIWYELGTSLVRVHDVLRLRETTTIYILERRPKSEDDAKDAKLGCVA